MATAKKLRIQARELLKQAEALDGKRMWVIALGGSDMNKPWATVIFAADHPSEAAACAATDADTDAVECGGIELATRQFKIEELIP